MKGKQIIEEIDFLRSQGEGLERITEVIQQQTTLKRQSVYGLMKRYGRDDLLSFLFPPKESAPVAREHGEWGRYAAGCRCHLCREANTARAAQHRRKRFSQEKDPADPRHGTSAFYSNHGCRCADCKEAHQKQVSKEYQDRLSRPIDPQDKRHGTVSFYKAYGCRCEPCKKASSIEWANRERRK